jgi:hypothetical protein
VSCLEFARANSLKKGRKVTANLINLNRLHHRIQLTQVWGVCAGGVLIHQIGCIRDVVSVFHLKIRRQTTWVTFIRGQTLQVDRQHHRQVIFAVAGQALEGVDQVPVIARR